jgi:hypothetical protein
VGEGLHVDGARARKLLRDILASRTLTFSGHAKKEMAKDVVVVLVSEQEAVVVTAWRIRR